jgi:hypothetical protein
MNVPQNMILAEPVFLRNLVITPVKGRTHSDFSPMTIDETLRVQKGYFKEREEPDISDIQFSNESGEPVLMLDGEEIIGAMQNRIITQSHIIEPHTTEYIPVVCVEEGRWEELGGFETGYCSYPRLRAVLLRSRYRKTDVQKTVWNEITRKMTVTRTQSATSSMHDIYDTLDDEVARYVEDFKSLNHGTVGFIGSAGDRILGCDLFHSTETYQKFEQKLIRSYALDALEYRQRRGNRPNTEQFLTSIMSVLQKRTNKGQPYIRFKGTGFFGQSVLHDHTIVHTSVFPA